MLLPLVLDAFGDDAQAQRMRELDDRIDDRTRIDAVLDVHHEAAIDLQLLGGQLAQVAQARVAGAEVVDRQVDARRAEAAEGRLGGLGVLHRHRFGDLAGEERRMDAVPTQRLLDALEDVLLAHLQCGQVHGEAHAQPLLAPPPRLPAGFLDDPVAQRADQSVALGQRDEHVRRHHAAPLVLPAQQRFCSRHLAALGVDLRLVEQLHLAVLERMPQIADHLELVVRVLVHRWRVEAVARTAGALRRADPRRHGPAPRSCRLLQWVPRSFSK